MTTHDQIKQLLAMGLTQAQISAGTGIRQGTISKIFNNPTRDVKSSTADAVTHFYNDHLAAA